MIPVIPMASTLLFTVILTVAQAFPNPAMYWYPKMVRHGIRWQVQIIMKIAPKWGLSGSLYQE